MTTQQTNIVQDGVDRFNSAFESFDREFQRIQKQVRSRRKSLEKRTRKQVNQLRSDLRKNTLVKRARSLREDVSKQVEQGVDNLLGALQIASKSDLQRIDRKLSQVNRKLKEMERTRTTNGGSPAV